MQLKGSLRDRESMALHPDNPRYFLFRGKPTILITSAEHYGAVLNLDFNYKTYLDELYAHGLNHTRVFSGVYHELPGSFNITDNPLAPKPGRYICPWPRTTKPGAVGGGNKYDLTRWNPAYFRRLKSFMRHAARRAVVVELNLFCPWYEESLWEVCPMNARNNVNGIGQCPREEVYNLKHRALTGVQVAVTQKIVRELKGFDNLYYEICNEPYAGVVSSQWQDRIVDAIVEAERSWKRKHLISLNVANHRAKIVKPNPRVSIFNFHYCVPPDVVAMNRGLRKPIGENETGFRGKADVIYRTEGWDFILAGGALYNNLDYSFTPKHPRGTFKTYASPGGGSRNLRHQLGILKKFINGFDFVTMRPDVSVIKGGVPKGFSVQALIRRGEAYAVYIHAPVGKGAEVVFQPALKRKLEEGVKRHRVNLKLAVPAGSYTVRWLSPATGKVEKSERIEHSGPMRTLKSPPFAEDLALGVRRLDY